MGRCGIVVAPAERDRVFSGTSGIRAKLRVQCLHSWNPSLDHDGIVARVCLSSVRSYFLSVYSRQVSSLGKLELIPCLVGCRSHIGRSVLLLEGVGSWGKMIGL